MSAKIAGQVWDLALSGSKQLVLLAMADHADHEGNNVYPSVKLIAWKTGYCERHVRRTIKALVQDGILVTTETRAGKTTKYRIDIEAGVKKPPFQNGKTVEQDVTPDTAVSPLTLDVTPDIAVSPPPLTQLCPTTPDIAMSPEPSVNRQVNPFKPQPQTSAEHVMEKIFANFGYDTDTLHRSKKREIRDVAIDLLKLGATPDDMDAYHKWLMDVHSKSWDNKPGTRTYAKYWADYQVYLKTKPVSPIWAPATIEERILPTPEQIADMKAMAQAARAWRKTA